MKQSSKIIFRLSDDMKAFVKEYAEKMGMDISEFMRLVLEYCYLFNR
jgi:antitoxin component of RelBE/YafQ-DinJ toxin-antitoxin module